MKVIAKNTFHGTEANLIVKANVITAATVKRLRKKLCSSDCNCFWDYTEFFQHTPGYRNYQNLQQKLYKSRTADNGILLEA
jgi:hypothetical protein